MKNIREINEQIKGLFYNKRSFFIKEMKSVSFFKKIRIFLTLHKWALVNYSVFFSSIMLETYMISNLRFTADFSNFLAFIGTIVIALLILLYIILSLVCIFQDDGLKDSNAFLFKKKREYYNLLSKESLSLETYKLLSQEISKEDFLKKTGNNDKLTYNDIGVDDAIITYFLAEKKDIKKEKLFFEKQKKNKKLKSFIDQLYKEIS